MVSLNINFIDTNIAFFPGHTIPIKKDIANRDEYKSLPNLVFSKKNFSKLILLSNLILNFLLTNDSGDKFNAFLFFFMAVNLLYEKFSNNC